ncbi:DNA-directed RNA polymerase sigma-70 factor [Fulvitalea axinellae]|uniref:DNA-directed RNA polymerase sigma-70 factor n=1 Tax=Fulvitalea axinellae TaxID=1182444 RepID=A0AAU9CN18_9BACT|nr:DNA-directed RNA polymerase sigma-70 factor [Fulvitalea axinellae]
MGVVNHGISDEALFGLVKQGDRQAYSFLYKKYWDELFRVAYHLTDSLADTEDLLHELFAELWLKKERVEIAGSFGAYVRTSLKYKVFRHYDRKRRKGEWNEEVMKDRLVAAGSADQPLSFEELYGLIEVAVENLPEKCRAVYKLSREENKNVREIAQILGISPNTAQNHINKALKELRLSLRDYVGVALLLSSIWNE